MVEQIPTTTEPVVVESNPEVTPVADQGSTEAPKRGRGGRGRRGGPPGVGGGGRGRGTMQKKNLNEMFANI